MDDYDRLGLNRYECENKATDMIAQLWGFAPDMVELQAETWHKYRFDNIESIKVGEDYCNRIEIYICKSPNNLYAVSSDYFFSMWGCGAYPHITNRIQYESRKEAVTAECEKIVNNERIQADKIGSKLIVQLVDKVAEMFPVYEQMELAL